MSLFPLTHPPTVSPAPHAVLTSVAEDCEATFSTSGEAASLNLAGIRAALSVLRVDDASSIGLTFIASGAWKRRKDEGKTKSARTECKRGSEDERGRCRANAVGEGEGEYEKAEI